MVLDQWLGAATFQCCPRLWGFVLFSIMILGYWLEGGAYSWSVVVIFVLGVIVRPLCMRVTGLMRVGKDYIQSCFCLWCYLQVGIWVREENIVLPSGCLGASGSRFGLGVRSCHRLALFRQSGCSALGGLRFGPAPNVVCERGV